MNIATALEGLNLNILNISPSSSSSGIPPNFVEDSGGDECLLVGCG